MEKIRIVRRLWVSFGNENAIGIDIKRQILKTLYNWRSYNDTEKRVYVN